MSGTEFARNFTLAGDAKFKWTTAIAPANSNQGIQFKLYAVPGPASAGLLLAGLGVLGFAAVRRRRPA